MRQTPGRLQYKVNVRHYNAMLVVQANDMLGSQDSPFCQVTIQKAEPDVAAGNKLGFSRAYSLSLSPHLIYTRSNLLPALVTSKVYRQLEFLAVGSWWIYDAESTEGKNSQGASSTPSSNHYLRKVPSSREDVVNDSSIDLRSQRIVSRFLQLATNVEAHESTLAEWGLSSFPDFLSSRFKMPERLQASFLALTLSPDLPKNTSTAYALPRIYRHLTSIGMFGPDFGAVIPKWGGLAEVAQVGCRAGAVGGGVYVLNKGIKTVEVKQTDGELNSHDAEPLVTLRLDGDEIIRAKRLVGSHYDIPADPAETPSEAAMAARNISIVSSSMTQLFPALAEGAPPPAAAVVVFPTGSLNIEDSELAQEYPPIYLMIHSSDTGECPAGQCTSALFSSPSKLYHDDPKN